MKALAALFVALVARHVQRHGLRLTLTVASVAIGISAIVAVQVANDTAIASFDDAARFISGRAVLQAVTNGAGFPDKAVVQMAALNGVAAALPVIDGSVTDPGTSSAYDLEGIDLLKALETRSGGAQFGAAGARLTGDVLRRGAAIVSESLARRLHATLGAPLHLLAGVHAAHLSVAGVLPDAAVPIGARGAVFCDISTAQEVLDRRGRVDRIGIVPSPRADTSIIAAAIARRWPGARLAAPSQAGTDVAKMTEAFRFNLAALAAIALLVGGFLVFNAVSMSVVQRRFDIGVARAVGATRAGVFTIFVLEGLLVGAVGSALGLIVGRLLGAGALRIVGGTIDALYAPVAAIGVTVPAHVYVLALLAGIGMAVAASILPAVEAASVAPALAMRAASWERPPAAPVRGYVLAGLALLVAAVCFSLLGPVNGKPVFGYASALAVLAACSALAAPAVAGAAATARALLPGSAGAPLRLAPENLRARVRRNGVAVASLMVGVAMTISVSTMIGSFRQSVDIWISQTLRGDLFLRPAAAVNAADVTMPPSVARLVAGLDGVAAVDVVRSKQISFENRPAFVAASDMRVTSRYGFLPLIDGGRWSDVGKQLIGANIALASEPFARKFGVRRGDTIALWSAGGPVHLRIAGVYEDYSSDAGYLFVDIATYRRLFGDDAINGVAVYARHGADIAALRGRIQAALGSDRIQVQTNADLRASALAQFDRTFAVTSVLDAIALIVALMGILSTLGSLVLERRREIGVLRSLGMARSQVRSMILGEAALLGIIGAALGAAAGYALAAILVYVINPQAFGWTIVFRAQPLYAVEVCVAVVFTAALAGLVPAAVAARLSVAEAVRME